MADTQLNDFVREALRAGSDRGAIRAALVEAGWPESQIDDAMNAFAEVDFPTPVPRPRVSVSAREAFLYLLTFILLAIAAGHFGALAFILIELANPEPNASLRAFSAAEGGIRWAVSALAVAWPLFLFVSARTDQARKKNPQMQRSGVRRWLTYIALVITAGVLVGDLITVVFNFLSGDLTSKLLLKATVVAVIAGAIFIHYGRNAERSGDTRDVFGLGLAGASTLAIIGAAVFGILAIDSPSDARARRVDDATLVKITAIAGAIDCHWQVNATLPADIPALQSAYAAEKLDVIEEPPIRCFISEFAGRENMDAIRYVRGAGASYQLCGTFERASDRRDALQRWRYPGPSFQELAGEYAQGEHCFDLTATGVRTDD